MESTYDKIIERLKNEVSAIVSGVDWARISIAASLLNNFSPRNALLISMQASRRGTSVSSLAGYHNWKKIGRYVRKGEEGYAILAPIFKESQGDGDGREVSYFKWVYVFDLDQTDGKDFDVPRPAAITEVSAYRDDLYGALIRLITQSGFRVTLERVDGANGLTDFSLRKVVISSELAPPQRLKTLTHELAHTIMHANGEKIDRNIAEIEAETLCHLLLAHFGIDSGEYSFPYIASWSQGDLRSVFQVAERIQTTLRETIRRVEINMVGHVVSFEIPWKYQMRHMKVSSAVSSRNDPFASIGSGIWGM
ncbi:MAG: ArdC-like ssDNA-binding domain-containing protein [Actinomycetota bacterium]|nr:ArdC-like ssDNA-binding domain-containing protein [Actinomycetota bacterium]